MKYTSIRDIPMFTRAPNHQVDVNWDYLQRWVDDHSPDLDPDFQRGHVWTRDQQIAFVEFCLRGGTSGRNLYFNSPRFISQREGLVMVDGKQRLTAVPSWMRGDFPVFGDTWREDLGPLPFSDHNTSFRVHVNNLKTRAEILRWYLEMNEGGTPHTAQELERVHQLARTLIMVILGDAGDDRAHVIERGAALEKRMRVLCLEQPVVDWRKR